MSIKDIISISIIPLAVIFLFFGGASVSGLEQPPQKGISLSPLREYIEVHAGKAHAGKIVITNNSSKAVDMVFSVEQFSVKDYTYEYVFTQPKEKLVNLAVDSITIGAGKSYILRYTLTIPQATPREGKYLVIKAATPSLSTSRSSTVSVASVLYVNVGGRAEQNSQLNKTAMPRLVVGNSIPFSVDIKNNGSTHFFIYTIARLQGFFVDSGQYVGTAHLLMPGVSRIVDGSISAPFFPGIYTVTYGYKTDSGATKVVSQRVVYIPHWSLFIFVGIVLFVGAARRRTIRRKATDS